MNYLRTELEGGIYYGLPWQGWRASVRGSAGYIFGWGGDDVRINDRFFKGGSSFRGFDVAGIGPRQLLVDDVDRRRSSQEGDAIGGNAYAIGTIQLDVPVPLPESLRPRRCAVHRFRHAWASWIRQPAHGRHPGRQPPHCRR